MKLVQLVSFYHAVYVKSTL